MQRSTRNTKQRHALDKARTWSNALNNQSSLITHTCAASMDTHAANSALASVPGAPHHVLGQAHQEQKWKLTFECNFWLALQNKIKLRVSILRTGSAPLPHTMTSLQKNPASATGNGTTTQCDWKTCALPIRTLAIIPRNIWQRIASANL